MATEQFAPNHELCYRCQGKGRERGIFYGVDPGDCRDCGGKGVVFKPTPPSTDGVNTGDGAERRVEAFIEKRRAAALKLCASSPDGDCEHANCPQLRDGEPAKTGRHCPLDLNGGDDE